MTNDKEKEDKHQLAQLYADSFRLKTQEHGWFAEKVQDFSAGYDAGLKAKLLAYEQMEELLQTQAAKISHLESVIQAADEFINLTKEMGIHYHDDGLLEALEKYNELKKQQ